MSGDKLDTTLSQVYSAPVYPSEELVKRTKSSIKRPGLLEYTIALSITLNLGIAFLFIYMITLGLNNIFAKVALFIIVSIIYNALILIICLYRDKVKEFFMRLETHTI